MYHWRRHLLTIGILLFLTLIMGPLGLGDWLWSVPRYLLRETMIAESLAGDSQAHTKTQDVVALSEEILYLQRTCADLREQLYAAQRMRAATDAGTLNVVSWDARVVSRTRGARQQMIDVHYVELDQGGLDAVQPGMAMCAGYSLLGVVTAVRRHQALVRLITDPQSRVAALIYDDTKKLAGGVLAGGRRSGLCRMLYVEDRPELLIKPGYMVVSAGTGDLIPEGLILGEVISARKSLSSDEWNIEVRPLRPVHASSEVLLCARAVRTAPEQSTSQSTSQSTPLSTPLQSPLQSR